MYRVNFNLAGFSFDEYFDNRKDAEYFAKDRQLFGVQTLILKVS